MKMKRVLSLIGALTIGVSMFVGCMGTDGKEGSKGDIRIVWYPNESGGDLEEAREEIGKIVEKATGRKVTHKLTTDYLVAIEALSNDGAEIGFTGAQGYIEAKNKNDKIAPLVVPSGPSGTLDDAVYYSWLSVRSGEETDYKDGNDYSIKNIKGKKMSFVSNSSTSGFKVPSSSIVKEFKEDNLTAEDLMQGGKDKFFNEVLFGGSHQGAAVNLLTNKSDIGAFCDTVMTNYIDVVEGKVNGVGTKYKIKDNANEPFKNLKGKEFVAINSTPVLNSPFVINENLLSDEEIKNLKDAFAGEETTNNEKIFIKEGSDGKGFFTKTDKEKFLEVEDSWFNPVRELSK